MAPQTCPPPQTQLPPLTSDLLHVEERLQSRVRMLEGEKREASLQVLELEKALAQQKKQCHVLMETIRKEHEEAMYKVPSLLPHTPPSVCLSCSPSVLHLSSFFAFSPLHLSISPIHLSFFIFSFLSSSSLPCLFSLLSPPFFISKVESERQRVSVEYRAYQEGQENKVKLLSAEISMQQEHHSTQMEKLQEMRSKLEHKLARELAGVYLAVFLTTECFSLGDREERSGW
jgi:hypothetical protein